MARQVLATEETFLAAYTERRIGRQYDHEVLTFRLADELYGAKIEWLREIVKMRLITEVPRAKFYLPGIITVRGRVIPIIDLRMRIGLSVNELTRQSRILIIEYENEPFGFIVDAVHKVVRMKNTDIEVAPLPGGIDSDLLAGVARVGGELIVLLDVASVCRFGFEANR